MKVYVLWTWMECEERVMSGIYASRAVAQLAAVLRLSAKEARFYDIEEEIVQTEAR